MHVDLFSDLVRIIKFFELFNFYYKFAFIYNFLVKRYGKENKH